MYYCMRGKMPPESANPVSTLLHPALLAGHPLGRCTWKKTTITAEHCGPGRWRSPLFFTLGSEFMPPLDEGSLLYMPVTLPNVSMTEAKRLIQVQDTIIKGLPEVEQRARQGRDGPRPPPTRRRSPCSSPSSC